MGKTCGSGAPKRYRQKYCRAACQTDSRQFIARKTREWRLEVFMSVQSASRRMAFYAVNIFMDILPYRLHHWRAKQFLRDLEQRPLTAAEKARLSCYNKLDSEFCLSNGVTNDAISSKRTYYYYDLKYYAKCFSPKDKLAYVFGDLTRVPDQPSIVKSRPVAGDNRNSVLMKLDQLRHYDLIRDPIAFKDKKPKAVWRGALNNLKRKTLVALHSGKDYCDVATTIGASNSKTSAVNFLSREEHLRFRYIISIEGRDVATNLKWIMASNSLCIMPAPVYETWFAESMLIPGVHYALVKDDFSDLEDVITYFEANPEKAQAVIANANAYVAQFRNQRREDILSYLVLDKYLRLARPAD